jgi:hypothetical protein
MAAKAPAAFPALMKVRTAMREILPSVTRFRRVGLITYGSGAWNQCNISLDLMPTPNAADRIMAAIDALRPAGRTPLTDAVAQAADALDFRHKPASSSFLPTARLRRLALRSVRKLRRSRPADGRVILR